MAVPIVTSIGAAGRNAQSRANHKPSPHRPMQTLGTEIRFALVTFETKLGWMGGVIQDQGVEHFRFGHDSAGALCATLPEGRQLSTGPVPKWWSNAQKLLVAYANGQKVNLQQIPVTQTSTTQFQKRVVESLLNVGYGQTVTYAQLAELADSPGAARAVGNQMARNCLPLIIPCHRVVGSGGNLGGFSAPQGLEMKRRLLDMESSQSRLGS